MLRIHNILVWIRIRASDYWIRIQEAQKHVDPDPDSDPQHWFAQVFFVQFDQNRVLRITFVLSRIRGYVHLIYGSGSFVNDFQDTNKK